MYGSNFCIVTLSPRALSNLPRLEAVRPLPRLEATPPVTKMCLVTRGVLTEEEIITYSSRIVIASNVGVFEELARVLLRHI